jgi:serine/threonine protein kinase/Tfp pilus assembly protein PilF
MRERDIFIEALQKEGPGDRAAYLHDACGADTALRSRVERLLHEHSRPDSFILDSPAPGLGEAQTIEPRIVLMPGGTLIDRYKLLEPIGEGGWGSVYMAEQTTPVQRHVALKIIKAGMDTRQVIARFEAERQALALMDHPNIAKVFDAGVTDTGRPYFVMELVKGTSITKYCDDKRLPPRARLELFVQVCQAVQHAHQKGIIHRDLKPSNVLVALYDGKPVPKVIDFGVAKATGQQLTERTMFTGFGDVIGTLEYMSPEQAEVNQLDVDTRSDIYSLGVLLYELLTGSTPLENKRARSAALLEMLRVVREEEPPRPSTRLRTSEELPSIAACRGLEPRKLSGLVHGELDWIVMKSLEKDRARRYETANGLAMDLQRYLADEAVHACPPTAWYRFRKFARRNRAALAAGVLLTVSAMVALSGIGWAVRDRAARAQLSDQQRTARQTKVSAQLDLIFEEVARLERAQKWSEALVSARRAESALATGEAPAEIQERAKKALDDLVLVERLDDIRARSGTVWVAAPVLKLAKKADGEYAAAFRDGGIDLDALPTSKAAERIAARRSIEAALLPALDDWVAVRSIDNDQAAIRRLTDVLRAVDSDPWRQRIRDALAAKDWSAVQKLVASPDLDRQPAATLTFLYALLSPRYMSREMDRILRRAQRKYPDDFWINHRLGVDLVYRQDRDEIREGIGFLHAAVALRPRSHHPLQNLGVGYAHLRQYDLAIECTRKAIELAPMHATGHANLGIHLSLSGRYDSAIAALQQSVELGPFPGESEAYAYLSIICSDRPDEQLRNLPRAAECAAKAVETDPKASMGWTALGVARYREHQWQEARIALEKSLQLATDSSQWWRWADAINWYVLAMTHWQLGQKDQARTCYDRAVQEMPNANTWQTDFGQVLRFRAEAEELLKITDQKPTTKPNST